MIHDACARLWNVLRTGQWFTNLSRAVFLGAVANLPPTWCEVRRPSPPTRSRIEGEAGSQGSFSKSDEETKLKLAASMVARYCPSSGRDVLHRNASIRKVLSGVSISDGYGGLHPLHSGIHSEVHVEDLEIVVDMHPEGLKTRNDHGDLPIHLALKRLCALPVLEFLVAAYPASLLVGDAQGFLPLHLAILLGLPSDVISVVVQQCPRAAEVSSDQGLPLVLAVQRGVALEAIRELVKAHPDALMTRDLSGRFPVHLLTKDTPLDVALFVIERSASSLMVKDKKGHTPLHCACLAGAHLSTISFLLKSNPDACASLDCNGDLPLHIAAREAAPLPVFQLLAKTYPAGLKAENYRGIKPLTLYGKKEQSASPGSIEAVLLYRMLYKMKRARSSSSLSKGSP